MWPFTKRTRTECVYPAEFLSYLRRNPYTDYYGSIYVLNDFVREKFNISYGINIKQYPAWFENIRPTSLSTYGWAYLVDKIETLIYHDWASYPSGFKVTFQKKGRFTK